MKSVYTEAIVRAILSDDKHELRGTSSGSNARKAASAQIAKISFPLAQHIARVFQDSPGGRT